ncbi:MAG: VCBS repeat-containing protein, partial [Microthrixaceae bacterium]|nr:VCBS repeat-containing protein [Microthrixaceae bacterium]
MHLALVTTTLQVLGQVVFDFELSIAQILISIATCAVIEIVVTFSRERTIAWPASAILTGNGIALILRTPGTEHGDWWSLNGWWVFVGCSVLAMASKYLIRRHGKHIFNPSNFALVLTFVLLGETRADPQVLWWGPLSVGLVIAFLVILAGSIAITRRVGQSDSALSFWVTFAAAVSVIAASGHAITARWHVGPIEGLDYWWLLVTSPEVLVFLFFMITDPKTAPRHRPAQVVYGTTIALLGALIIATQPGEFGTKVGILAGLVLICPFVALLDRRFETFPRPIHTARFASLAVLGLALIATALFLLGMAFTADAGGEVPLERRSEVSLDPSTLPEVSIAQDAVVSSVTLDEAMAEAMAMATAEDLMLEELALSTADAELAAAALSGTRLAQAETAIEAAGDTPPEAAQYTFDEMSATVIRTSSGPQVPPQLAIRVTGTVTRNGATEDLEATYTLVPVGGTFLITDAFDADGNPMGDRPGAAPGIEPATEPEDRAPGDNELDGLAFEDVTAQVGLDFEHSDRALFEGPAAASGGAAVGDYDGDGDPDVFLSRVGLPSLLLRNDAGRFTDVTAQSGLGVDTPLDGSTGALFADLTGDGILDLVVLGLRNTPDRLFIGQADHTFVPASGGWELPQRPNSADAIRYSAAVGDYDGDGRLDLFLAGGDPTAVEESTATAGGTCSPNSHADPGRSGEATDAAAQSLLLRNTGTGFEDRTADLGVDPATLVTMSARFADVNADTRPDLLLAGMLCTSKVLLNDGDGTFTDASGESDVARIHTAHASSVLDADGDGVLDWYLTGTAYPTESGDCPMEDPRWGCD